MHGDVKYETRKRLVIHTTNKNFSDASLEFTTTATLIIENREVRVHSYNMRILPILVDPVEALENEEKKLERLTYDEAMKRAEWILKLVEEAKSRGYEIEVREATTQQVEDEDDTVPDYDDWEEEDWEEEEIEEW